MSFATLHSRVQATDHPAQTHRRRDTLVGLAVVAALTAFVLLLIKAGKGPGYLADRTEIDVVFSDGQGIRAGSPVRISGLDVGQVSDVGLVEYNGRLLARLKLALPTDLMTKLREDVKVTISTGLTGQGCVNVINTGQSPTPLKAEQTVQGVESSMFDPILKEVGLGPEERADLGYTIRKLRQTLDQAAPLIAASVSDARRTIGTVRATVDDVRPGLMQTVSHVEAITQKIGAQAPKIEAALSQFQALASDVQTLVAKNRPKIDATIDNVQTLSSTASRTLATEAPKISKLIDGLEPVRARAERALYNVENITDQTGDMVARNRANIDRSALNIRDATEWASQLVQKIYSNPFVLSPFHKPRPEDARSQAVIDTGRYFLKGASELSDLFKTVEALQKMPATPKRQQEIDQLYRSALELLQQLRVAEQQLADGVRQQAAPRMQNRR